MTVVGAQTGGACLAKTPPPISDAAGLPYDVVLLPSLSLSPNTPFPLSHFLINGAGRGTIRAF